MLAQFCVAKPVACRWAIKRTRKKRRSFLLHTFLPLQHAGVRTTKPVGDHNKKSLKAQGFQGFFLFLESADPYLDPLCFCHTMDVLIHSVCAFTFHAVCGVSVHIKGKRRGLMSEILLHSLDVIAGLQAVYGVSMTKEVVFMKKLVSILCAGAMLLSLAACGAKADTTYAGQTITGKVTALEAHP